MLGYKSPHYDLSEPIDGCWDMVCGVVLVFVPMVRFCKDWAADEVDWLSLLAGVGAEDAVSSWTCRSTMH